MEQQPGSSGLLGLDQELLSSIISFIDTRDLFPSCFLICRALLSATLDELAWQRRCLCDLQISDPHETEEGEVFTWFNTYRGSHSLLPLLSPPQTNPPLLRIENSSAWDLEYCTLPTEPREALIEELKSKGYELSEAGAPHNNMRTRGKDQNIWAQGTKLTWRETK